MKDATKAMKGEEMNREAKAKFAKKKKVEDKKAADMAMKKMYGEMSNAPRNKKTGKRMTRNEVAAEKKAQEKVEEERRKKEEFWASLSLEEKIEHKRAALDTSQCTPVTAESFAAWRQAKIDKKMEEAAKILAAQSKDKRKGKAKGGSGISGKALFALDASLFKDDDQGVSLDDDILAMSEPDEEEEDEDKDSDSDSSSSDSDSDDDDEKEETKKEEKKEVVKKEVVKEVVKEAPKQAAAPPAAPAVKAEVAAAGKTVTLQKDLYMDDDGLDDLDDLSDDDE